MSRIARLIFFFFFFYIYTFPDMRREAAFALPNTERPVAKVSLTDWFDCTIRIVSTSGINYESNCSALSPLIKNYCSSRSQSLSKRHRSFLACVLRLFRKINRY